MWAEYLVSVSNKFIITDSAGSGIPMTIKMAFVASTLSTQL